MELLLKKDRDNLILFKKSNSSSQELLFSFSLVNLLNKENKDILKLKLSE
jgi:hypothetical protein